MSLTHIVLTRFSYRDTSTFLNRAVIKSNVSTVDPLNPQRLERRFQLFELFCLPSVLAQTTKAFTWILLVDPELPPRYRERLRELTKSHRQTHLVDVTSVDELAGLRWLQPYIDRPSTHIATTNVDDDDLMGARLLQYTRDTLRKLGERGELMPCHIVGCVESPQWDFLPTRRAPLGYLKPWGHTHPSFTGYTVCCEQPHYDLSALAFEHYVGGQYFDPAKNLESVTQAKIRSAAERAGHDWRTWRPEQALHVVESVHPQVVVLNHLENDDVMRLFRSWSKRRPVTGPSDFPEMPGVFERVPAAIQTFRRSPAALMRLMYRRTRLAMNADWTFRTRRQLLWHTMLAPLWFVIGLPERRRMP